MLPVSPAMFATLVSGALRLGRESYRAYLTGISRDQALVLAIPDLAGIAGGEPYRAAGSVAARQWTCGIIERLRQHADGQSFAGVFQLTDGGGIDYDLVSGLPKIADEILLEAAIAHHLAEMEAFRAEGNSVARARGALIVYQHKVWSNENERSPFGVFFRHVIDVGFDILAAQPGLLGARGNVETFVSALFPNLAALYDAEAAPGTGARTALLNVFAEAALKTISGNPGLVTTEKRWEPLILGVLKPLQDEVEAHGFNQLFAERRIQKLVGGPMAYAALNAFSDNADDFLKGEADRNGLLGAVARETLGAFVSTGPEGATVRQIFSEAGAVMAFKSALKVAQETPQLFIRSSNDGDPGIGAARKLLSGIASKLIDAEKPFGKDGDLGPEIAAMTLGVVSDYMTVRLKRRAGGDEAALMGADIAASLLGALMEGVRKGVAAGPATRGNIFETVFTRAQATDVLRIMASHVAKSPHLALGKDANPQVVVLAESVALAISSDEGDLLTGDDWRGIISVALDTSLRNPGRLFSLDASASPADSIALQLTMRVLRAAKDAMDADGPVSGKVLFGETLAGAIRATLVSAASGALAAIKETTTDPGKLADHFTAIEELARRLNRLAASKDPGRVISADDWLRIYTFYVATALEKGLPFVAGGGPDEDGLSDDDLLMVLRDGISESGTGAEG